jgi:hypothetical protein
VNWGVEAKMFGDAARRGRVLVAMVAKLSTFRQAVCIPETRIVKRCSEPLGIRRSLNGTVVGRCQRGKGLPAPADLLWKLFLVL